MSKKNTKKKNVSKKHKARTNQKQQQTKKKKKKVQPHKYDEKWIKNIINMFGNNTDSFPLRQYLCACLDRLYLPQLFLFIAITHIRKQYKTKQNTTKHTHTHTHTSDTAKAQSTYKHIKLKQVSRNKK